MRRAALIVATFAFAVAGGYLASKAWSEAA
jgi:hypothetical protein